MFPGPLISVISIIFTNLWRYSQLKVHHLCQQHWGSHFSWDLLQFNQGDTGSKFATGVYGAGSKLTPMSTTPAVNCRRCQRHQWSTRTTVTDCIHLELQTKYEKKPSAFNFFPFVTGVIDTGSAPWAVNIFVNFLKVWNDPNGTHNQGSGGNDLWQKPEVTQISWHCSSSW